MASTKIPQSRVNGLLEAFALKQDKTDNSLATTSKEVVGAINELAIKKANVTDLSHVPAGLTHSISGKSLVIAPGHVLNYAGNEVLISSSNITQEIGTVTEGLQSGLILGDTAERIDILDYTTLSSEFTSQGRIIPVASLGGYDNFATGTVNSAGSGFADAVAMFYEGSASSKSAGFLFDSPKEIGEYVVTVGSDVQVSTARIAFYALTGTEEEEDGTYTYNLQLVSQSIVDATTSADGVSLTAIAGGEFQAIAVAVDVDAARYCRMYKVDVAATYNTFICKQASGFIVKLALSEEAISGSYSNFAKVGQVTIGDGPVACYPEKDIASAYADGDLKQQEPSYSNFYTRKEMDTLIDDIDRVKADKATTLAGYGITDAYTKTETNNLLNTKQDVLTAGTNISIQYDSETQNTVISTTFAETYSKAEVDNLLQTLDEEKADKATTLEGYGITDAYTKTEANSLINAKQNAIDNTLTTDSKNIASAINELHEDIQNFGIAIERLD